MHNDEVTPPPSAPEGYTPSAPKLEPRVQRLPAELDNWQVWDIDGVATDNVDAADIDPMPRIPDRQDDVLIVTLAERRWQVEPGGVVTLPITVLNNSTRGLTARAHLEGWLDDRWVVEPYLQAAIAPGERRTLELTIAPPRARDAEAGDYHLVVVVRSPDAPEHMARAGLVLTLLPFERVLLELLDAPEQAATWWRRSLVLPLRVANEGNRPLALTLEGTAPARLGRTTFPGSSDETRTQLSLRPGQRVRVPVRLTVTRLPWAALHSRALPYGLTARAEDGALLQQLRGAVEVRPVIGAWQMASLAGLAGAGFVAMILFVLVSALFLRANTLDPQASAPAAPPAPAIIIVTLNQPVAPPDSAGDSAHTAQSLASAIQSQPDPSLPLVLPDQVTAPGSGGPVRTGMQPSSKPDAAPISGAGATASGGAVSGGAAPMTYAQMFQSVSAQYDLDWRMLAAQAYVESGFDALALSSAGAMGLMQVLPTTWREWAPAVGASDPFDSYSNVQVAAVYLDYLRTQMAQQGRPEKEWMLVAYNWGIDRLGEFLDNGGEWQDLPEARRKYAEDILRTAQTLP